MRPRPFKVVVTGNDKVGWKRPSHSSPTVIEQWDDIVKGFFRIFSEKVVNNWLEGNGNRFCFLSFGKFRQSKLRQTTYIEKNCLVAQREMLSSRVFSSLLRN